MHATPWPPELAEKYRTTGAWTGENFDDILTTRARDRRFADKIAVVDDERSLTYAELDERVERLAAGLVGLGLSLIHI